VLAGLKPQLLLIGQRMPGALSPNGWLTAAQ
jgi:hypothetical protein